MMDQMEPKRCSEEREEIPGNFSKIELIVSLHVKILK